MNLYSFVFAAAHIWIEIKKSWIEMLRSPLNMLAVISLAVASALSALLFVKSIIGGAPSWHNVFEILMMFFMFLGLLVTRTAKRNLSHGLYVKISKTVLALTALFLLIILLV